MQLNEAINKCHIRSAIMRLSKPNLKYWKNHPVPIIDRILSEDVGATDWVEYDPRDYDGGSLFMFND